MIRIHRGLAESPTLHGYLVGLSPAFGMMHCFDDFEPDGYAIFRVDDVLDVEQGVNEKHWDKMLLGEGLVDGLTPPVTVDLADLASCIRSIHGQFADLIVECEDAAEDECEFYLGRLLAVTEDSVSLLYIDALGKWDEEPTAIPLKQVTKIEFDTPYLRRFMRYAEPFPAN